MDTSQEFNKIINKYEAESLSDCEFLNNVTNPCITSIYENEDLQEASFIDLEGLNFENEETWLYTCKETCPTKSNPPETVVHDWLNDSLTFKRTQIATSFDTRTFTRPKKRTTNLSDTVVRDVSKEVPLNAGDTTYTSLNSKPLHFDLTQPAKVNNFDQILETATDSLDFFQNMSPPSLCSISMCSSTLTNLMENSYIKNDIEEEADDTIIIEDSDNNCKSNDRFEFLENDLSTKYNTYNKNSNTFSKSKNNDENCFDATFNVSTNEKNNIDSTFTCPLKETTNNVTPDMKIQSPKNFNSTQTISKPMDTNNTFTRSSPRQLNSTYQKLSDSQPDLTAVHKAQSNQNTEINNRTVELAPNAIGSTDSLEERLSNFSDSSSKDSHHINNVEDWEAIAKSQELSLSKCVSTPKPNYNKFYMNDVEQYLSPIVKPTSSDSDLSVASSGDDCNTFHSGSSKTSSHGSLSNATFKRSENRGIQKRETFIKPAGTTERRMLVPQAQPSNMAGPRSIPVRAIAKPSGLPRPSAPSTGIPRPTSRIPAPKFARPPAPRSLLQRPNSGSRTNLNEPKY